MINESKWSKFRWNPVLQRLRDAASDALYDTGVGDIIELPANYQVAVEDDNCYDSLMKFVVIEMAEGSEGEASTPAELKARVTELISMAQLELAVIANAIARCPVDDLSLETR